MLRHSIVFILSWFLFVSSAFCTSTPVEAKSKSPKLTSSNITLKVGKTKKLKVKNTTANVKWSSSKKKVASVSKSGLVKAKKEGEAIITAKVGKKRLKCKVEVIGKNGGKVKAVSVGIDHTAILKKDDSLWMCGDNGYGQLGAGSVKQLNTPVKIMSDVESVSTGEQYATGIVKKDGTLWMCGDNSDGKFGNGHAKKRNKTPLKIM